MLYRAVYQAGKEWHTLCFWWSKAYPEEAVDFAERFVKRLEPWYNDARLTHVLEAKNQPEQLQMWIDESQRLG